MNLSKKLGSRYRAVLNLLRAQKRPDNARDRLRFPQSKNLTQFHLLLIAKDQPNGAGLVSYLFRANPRGCWSNA